MDVSCNFPWSRELVPRSIYFMITSRQTGRGSEEDKEEEETGAGTWLGRTAHWLAEEAQKYCLYNVYMAFRCDP